METENFTVCPAPPMQEECCHQIHGHPGTSKHPQAQAPLLGQGGPRAGKGLGSPGKGIPEVYVAKKGLEASTPDGTTVRDPQCGPKPLPHGHGARLRVSVSQPLLHRRLRWDKGAEIPQGPEGHC